MSTATLFTAALEAALDGLLAADPEAAAGLTALDGKVIAVELRGLGQTLYFLPAEGRIAVMLNYEGSPDTLISGTPLALARMGLGKTGEGLFGGEVQIRGDSAVGHRFQALLASLEFDWEEWLSRLVGDAAAHQAGRLLRETGSFLQHSADTLRQDLGEYLREEARLLPTRYEIEDFMAEVDRCREDVDRLEARVKRLETRLARRQRDDA
ncbi:SCP2 sterol-binding domain-containing protein [Thiohalobacter sp. IOR34]|uniref:ubiquinone biosynthesis accessory factor UbiJ n=1 Tax=Thiohalobacter sp. IOR34 TaxID=3057176 RepID=UPI0025AF8F29|nr:SCP2 sterol-binding domain-containing protein [Thiohalobacter sp. IOR34]WJW75570.1 SCP2 sterol-binding domain-containing protein [Thiohalobacter sp. IOR34]